jgi:hypothetical protein
MLLFVIYQHEARRRYRTKLMQLSQRNENLTVRSHDWEVGETLPSHHVEPLVH